MVVCSKCASMVYTFQRPSVVVLLVVPPAKSISLDLVVDQVVPIGKVHTRLDLVDWLMP